MNITRTPRSNRFCLDNNTWYLFHQSPANKLFRVDIPDIPRWQVFGVDGFHCHKFHIKAHSVVLRRLDRNTAASQPWLLRDRLDTDAGFEFDSKPSTPNGAQGAEVE